VLADVSRKTQEQSARSHRPLPPRLGDKAGELADTLSEGR
jgi:hypothetical protein